jgi:hypothetical protein
LRDDLETLSSLLKDAELIEESEGVVTLRIENVVNYGEDFTESVQVTIPRKVLEGLGIEK